VPTFIVLLGFTLALVVLISVISVVAELIDARRTRESMRGLIRIKGGKIYDASSGRSIRSILRGG